MELDLDRALKHAIDAVQDAGRAALPYFRTDLVIETKPDRSPVTMADRDSEAAIIAAIRAHYPDHGILGEETGKHEMPSRYRWIIDPIDGTRGFTRGGSFWGPLLALMDGDRVIAGAMMLPALGDVYWAAKGRGAYKNGKRLQVSKLADWSESTLSVGELRGLLAKHDRPLVELMRSAASVRCYGDLAGAAMVLEGRAEAWIEGGVQIWDLAPISILVEEAGGKFTDFSGNPSPATGNAIVTNGLFHDFLLKKLSEAR
jgi:histidinol-phosphatase